VTSNNRRRSVFRSKRWARGWEQRNRTEVTRARRGEDKGRVGDSGENEDKDRGENVGKIFIQVDEQITVKGEKEKRQNGGRTSPLMYIFSPSMRRC
jgi:hypothetical protein